jgi:EAL domain-containing protein (putative c-di-GMP-specific phosphodiesterase class I)
VVSALGASGLPASRLELEITEAVMLQDTETTLATLAQLKGLGVRISMDDFGTGYSSLSYLRKFPFDKIKIDQSFIRDLSTRPESMAIIRAIAGLGAALGIATTAEGVETEDQLRVVRAEGCTQVQGYLLGRPQPASTIPGLLLEFENKRSLAV